MAIATAPSGVWQLVWIMTSHELSSRRAGRQYSWMNCSSSVRFWYKSAVDAILLFLMVSPPLFSCLSALDFVFVHSVVCDLYHLIQVNVLIHRLDAETDAGFYLVRLVRNAVVAV